MRILVFNLRLIFFCLFLTPFCLFAQNVNLASVETIGVDSRKVRQVISPKATDQKLELQHLEAGAVYTLSVPGDPALRNCRPLISAAGTAVKILNLSDNGHRIRFVAGSEVELFNLHYPCSWQSADPLRHHISLAREPETNGAVKTLLRALGNAGELTVKGGLSPDYLVKDVFIGGDCYDVKNVVFSGRPGQIGSFSNGKTSINMEEGVIITSGHINLAPGPNTVTDATVNYSLFTPDQDLTQMALTRGTIDNEIYDMASLEFDFTPTGNVATFEFVFASEEYCEYINSLFNDVFGFFISGPGITGPFSGAENIARVPVTNDYVAVNSINNALNQQYFINNAGPTDSCVVAGPVGISVNEIQYDGYTVVLRAQINVQPCKTYRLKLKIADLSDDILDSAIFLKAGSFDAGAKAHADFVVNGDPNLDRVFENCGMVELRFDRVSSDVNTPINIGFMVGGTAASGVDYEQLPSNISLGAGIDKISIPVKIFHDLLAETRDSIVILLKNGCSCSDPDEVLKIIDKPAFSAKPDTSSTCSAGIGLVGVSGTGGVPPYSYLWPGGQTTQTIAPGITGPTDFQVIVQDACAQKDTVVSRIEVHAPPTAQLIPPAPQICLDGAANMTIQFSGAGPFAIEYSIDNVKQPPVTGIVENPYFLPANRAGLYQITRVTDRSGCFGPGQGVLTVAASTLALKGVSANATCAGLSNGAINTTPSGGTGPYKFTWTGPQVIGNAEDATNLKPGVYQVTVEDAIGCRISQQFEIKENVAINAAVAAVQNTNCNNPNGGSIQLETSGGTPSYSYKWSTGATTQNLQNLDAGNYTVTVTDLIGCTRVVEALVQGDLKKPAAAVAIPDTIGCAKTTVLLQGTGSSTGTDFGYTWMADPGNLIGGVNGLNAVVDKPGSYTLVVTDKTNGCTAVASRQVIESKIAPAANAGPPRTLNCTFRQISLDGSGSAKGPQFSYLWSADQGGILAAGATSTAPVVTAPGVYTLLVRNNATGCTATASVTVDQNIVEPKALIANPLQLTCATAAVTLSGSASTPGNLTYLWTSNGGVFQSGRTSPTVMVGAAGTYNLVVTNPQNGCMDTASVDVTQDYTEPQAIVTANGFLNCKTQQVTLSGSESNSQSNNTFVWIVSSGGNIVSGKNTLTPLINAPGTYTLVITNTASKCSSSASVTVVKDVKPPDAMVGGIPGLLTCAVKTLTLGNKNIPANPNYTYNWSTNNGNLLSGQNSPNPMVDRPGVYSLVVTNTANQCSDTASVVIQQNLTPPLATAGPVAQLDCNVSAVTLNGAGSSVGPNITYQWSSAGGSGIGAGANTLNPTVTAIGTYTLTVTDAGNGCSSTATTSVMANPNLPTAAITKPDTITCDQPLITLNSAGSSTGPNYTYRWGTVDGVITGASTGASATVSKAGRYTLIVTNSNTNCSVAVSVDVKVDKTPPLASAGPNQIFNCTMLSTELDGSTSSQGGQYAYSWAALGNGNILSGAGSTKAQVNAVGTYELVVTDLKNGCTATDLTEVIPDPANPLAVIKTPDTITCKSAMLQLDGSGSSSGSTYSYQWNGPGILSGADAAVATVAQSGKYTLVVTNTANGCTASALIDVSQNISFPIVDAGPDMRLDCYSPERKVKLPFNSNTKDFTYEWSGPKVISGGDTPEPVLGDGGVYRLKITAKNNGCAGVDSIVVTADFEKPKSDAGPPFQLTCTQNTYTLQATADQGLNYIYRWETTRGSFLTPQNILNPTVNGAGEYYLTVTNALNGCRSVAQVQISQAIDLPVVAIALPKLLTCKDKTVALDGSGSSQGARFVYRWYPDPVGRIVSGANTLHPVVDTQGVYALEIRDTTNGCIAFSSIQVEKNTDKPVVDAGTSARLTCTRTKIALKGIVSTNSTFTYRWETAGGGQIIADANTLSPLIDQTGLYRLIVTDERNGCVQTDSVQVLADRAVPVAAVPDTVMLNCRMPQGVISAVALGQGALSFLWSTINGHILGDNTDSELAVDKAGTYKVIVTEIKNGCTATATASVVQNKIPPIVGAGAGRSINCAAPAVQLSGTLGSNPDNIFIQWTTTSGAILAGDNTLTPTVIAGGVYTITAIDKTNGCTASDRVDVSEDKVMPFITVTTPDILTCSKTQIPITGIGSQTGASISYAWKTIDGSIVSGQNTIRAIINAPGAYTFTVLNNANGCVSEAVVDVSANQVPPVADAGPPQTLTCNMEEATLKGEAAKDPGIEFTWSTRNGLILDGKNTLSPRVGREGVYTITVINRTTGCVNQDDVWVQEEPNVPNDFEILLKNPTCKTNDGVISFGKIIGGIGPYLYSMDGGRTFSSELSFKNISPGKYLLRIQDLNGCEFEKSLTVPEAPKPGIQLPSDFNIQLGDSLQIIAELPPDYPLSLIDSIVWTPLEGLFFNSTRLQDQLKPFVKPLRNIVYSVTLISKDGCRASDRVAIEVDTDPKIYVPNVIDPKAVLNGNHLITVFAKEGQVKKVHSFRIFSRWGEMVYQALDFLPNSRKIGWDGYYRRDKDVVPAVFVWKAAVELIDGKMVYRAGDVTVLGQ